MGMTNKQFYGMLATLVGIVLYSGIAFSVAERFGVMWGIVALNILNIGFFMYMMFKSKDMKNEW